MSNFTYAGYIHRSKVGVYGEFGTGIVAEYNRQREQNYNKMMNRFKQNYVQSISQAPNELLNAALNQDELIESIDENVLSILQDNFSEALQSLSTSIVNLQISAKEYGAQYVQQYLENSASRKARESFSKMFEDIAKAAELVYGDNSILAHILQTANTYGEIKQKLQQTRFNLNGKIVSINNTEEKKAIQYLNNLIAAIESRSLLAKDGTINMQGFHSSFNNIFSTNFGENLLKSLVLGNPDIYKNIIDEVNNLGSKNITISLDSELRGLAQQGTQVYKVDSQLKNFSVSVDVNGTKADIVLDIGTSIKNYQSKPSKVSITGEKTLMYRLSQLFRNQQDLMIAYNVVANSDTMTVEYNMLKSNIMSYFADVFISGIGAEGDFSQYIIINGNFYSIYDILTKIKDVESNIISVNPIGIPKVTNFQQSRRDENANVIRAYKNSRISRDLLQGVSLHASFYPNRYNALI